MQWLSTRSPRWQYALAGASILAATLVFAVLPTPLEPTNIALVYLLLVVICATSFGRGPAVAASLLAFFCSNFFLVMPRYTFAVDSPQDVLQLLVTLLVAVICSNLAGGVRQQAMLAEEHARELATMYTLSQAISAEVDLNRILPVIAQATAAMLRVPSCRILLYDVHGLRETRAAYGTVPEDAKIVDTIIHSGTQTLGVVQVTQRAANERLGVADHARLNLITGQIASALQRARLAHEAGAARSLAESDRFKSVLLMSVSHDLRTPIALIKGAATSLIDETIAWSVEARRELLQTIDESADRLNRLVGNVLEMARIEANALPQTRSWQDMAELAELVLGRMRAQLHAHAVQITNTAPGHAVLVNATQIDQVLTNLLENVLKHTPPGTPIDIAISADAAMLHVAIRDRGPGIPADMTVRIFERFVRAAAPERHAEGSGLGLAVAKGLVEAHGGTIRAANAPDGGACFSFTLPLRPSPGAEREGART